ncbi:UPF0149 family protein [Diaphorobacter ruginosibacter]|uniref:UPF0149 family protein n=1 Tax=Diaphorobacter ruginosibacter TaxID=1715720 RepID=A0A7G9RPU8_9BURK|nr:YecA family protein [Diaphorobacter ruginosibacter]QNN57623.1 UPF0149 family protein [Diaphorobacter ruginosibacter]
MAAQDPTLDATPSTDEFNPALSNDALDELDAILDDVRSRNEETPQWEFCDGYLTALVCTRRPVPVTEWLPMLLGDGAEIEGVQQEGQPLPLQADIFQDEAQQARFLELCGLRLHEVASQLDIETDSLDADDAFQPECMDMRGAISMLPEEERAEMADQDIPSFAQVWALGFMFAVENWPDEWTAPRDKDAAKWIDDSLEKIVAITEDDTGKPAVNMYDDAGPASTSQERVEQVGEAIWACYDLRQIWKSFGPRVETIRKEAEPGRNDPCPCGSGKKYKKCHGA